MSKYKSKVEYLATDTSYGYLYDRKRRRKYCMLKQLNNLLRINVPAALLETNFTHLVTNTKYAKL